MKYKILFLLLFFSSVSLSAQEKKVVHNITARWVVSDDITPKQAEDKAILEAKKKALREAGVLEEVWSAFGQVSTNVRQDFYEAYNQMSAVAIGGLMKVLKQQVWKEWDPSSQTLSKVVCLDAEVLLSSKPDVEFALRVDRIQDFYRNGSEMSMNVTVLNKDAYLTIFWFDDSGGEIIYPNNLDSYGLLEAGREYLFPPSGLAYQLTKESRVPAENINLMFIATKKNIPFSESKVTFESVLKWIYKIPAEERFTVLKMIQVTD